MRLIIRGWRVRIAAGTQGHERWHVSVGLRREWLSFAHGGLREVRLVMLGLYLHWRVHG